MDSNTTTRSAPPKHIAQQRGPGARGSAARARAQEAAASLRSTLVVSRIGIELGPDVLLEMRLVLLKSGDRPEPVWPESTHHPTDRVHCLRNQGVVANVLRGAGQTNDEGDDGVRHPEPHRLGQRSGKYPRRTNTVRL